MIPKPPQKKLFSCCLSVIRNESKSREQLSSNGNVKSSTFIRQGLSLPQSANEYSPARKHLIKTQLKMPKILVEEIGLVKPCPPPIQEERKRQGVGEWGLLHEKSARKAYQHFASHTYHKLKLIPKGFSICPSKPSPCASVDNVQECQCSDGCP